MEKYQITKTVRFGLTLKQSTKKNESHQILKGLCLESAKRIESETKGDDYDENKMIKQISDCLIQMEEYIENWNSVFRRTDQIAVTKDFYRRLSRKACFDGFWIDKKKKDGNLISTKMPQSSTIKLSSLSKEYFDKSRKDYILDYWTKNILEVKHLAKNFKSILNQFKNALDNSSQAHEKPNLVDFRKMFLSLVSVINETLIPLDNRSINFPDIEKMSDENRNKYFKQFVSTVGVENRSRLLNDISELKKTFEGIGGYVPFGRVTLNRFTAQQKPHVFRDELKECIEDDLRLIHFINKFIGKSKAEVQSYFKDQDKTKTFKNENLSVIERTQAFKFKSISASVRFMLAEYLAKNYEFKEEELSELFDAIGEPVSIGEQYLRDAENFNLNDYPLKLAFDYAWENLARSIYHKDTNFPKQQCEQFLKDKFSIDCNDLNLKLYADLLQVKECLATLEHEKNELNNRQKFINQMHHILGSIECSGENKLDQKHIKAIMNWLAKTPEQQKQSREDKEDKSFENYKNAKQKIGRLRGSQKNAVKKYDELTKYFKGLSSNFGKTFADVRDKLREQNELNKVAYSGMIIEDENKDKYLLLAGLDENREEQNLIPYDENQGEFKTYQVKSLTSKALIKILKNFGGYKNFHMSDKKINQTEMKRNWEEYQNNPILLDYLKDCLVSSLMAKEQDWEEFHLKIADCKKYSDIEREIDQKAYILKKGKIALDKLIDLVKNKKCVLCPIVNQDITSAQRNLKNQFSKDWKEMFSLESKAYRLHPEFNIVYRHPTPGYPKPGEKRYSRFQMIANFLCEYIPQDSSYVSKKEQAQIFNSVEKQEENVECFNEKMKLPDDYYVIGIDRGEKQLVTLCVLDKDGKIQNDFDIYTREFLEDKKCWKHSILEQAKDKAILDLSNLRVETTVEGEKVLVDLSSIKVKENKTDKTPTKNNQQTVKLKQLAYVRKLQYAMQSKENHQEILEVAKLPVDQRMKASQDLITTFGVGKSFADLPMEQINDLLDNFKKIMSIPEPDQKELNELNRLIELDSADSLKRGVVGNMVGVIAFLLEHYNYKVYISLENLSRAWANAVDGLNGIKLPKNFKDNSEDNSMDYKKMANAKLAGLGTYHYFEIQLLNRLFKIQNKNIISHYVPAFRSVDNYESIRKITKNEGNKYVCKPFGIVRFIDPQYTSLRCPECGVIGKTKVKRKTEDDSIFCKKCNFSTDNNSNPKLRFIKSGDDNGAYHIALKTVDNEQKKRRQNTKKE